MTVTVQPGALPFHVLDLIGKRKAELPGVWEPVPTPREPGGALERLRYTASGWVDGSPVDFHVYARLFRDEVWAVGVEAPELVFRVVTEDDRPRLVTVDHPPGTAPLVNWISQRNGRYYDVGLAP